MQFLFPGFLWALLALAIPIIIHLFYFRRFKKVYFSNVRFLKEVKEETSARSRLRNLLVLASRMLALAGLVFAFAQPFIPGGQNTLTGNKAVSVFVDNSFSMNALSEDVALLTKAKQRAREIVEAYNVEDEFQILTNDFEGRHQRLISQEDALAMIDEIEASPSVRSLDQVARRQLQALQTGQADNQLIYQISDFQQNITKLEASADTSVLTYLVPLQAVQERNIAIDSAWFARPVQLLNQPNPLIVRVKNLSNEPSENIRLSVRYDEQTRPVGTLSLPSGGSVLDTVNISILQPGWHEGKLSVTDFPIQFDDDYYFSYQVAEQIKVLEIHNGRPDAFLGNAFKGAGYISLTSQNTNQIDYSAFGQYNLIVLQGVANVTSGLANELRQYMDNGGNVLVFPPKGADIASYRNFLSSVSANELAAFEDSPREVGRINQQEFIFSDVYENTNRNFRLPSTQGNYRLTSYGSRPEERLLTYRDGSPYLVKYRTGQGHLYLCAAPIDTDYNNLVRQGEIFVPMLFKMAVSAGEARPIAYTIGDGSQLVAKHQSELSDQAYRLKGPQEEFIPEQRIVGAQVFLSAPDQIRTAGFYNLLLEGDEIRDKFAFNFDRRESDLRYFNVADLKQQLPLAYNILETSGNAPLTARIEAESQGVPLWRWFIIAALAFLLLEVLLLRFWKV